VEVNVATRRVYSHKVALLRSSREAALAAIQTYNNPLITFKTETFIVLMVMAWTYLLHAHYRGAKVEYRYYKQGTKRRMFDRVDGRHRYWDLAKCLKVEQCPIDRDTRNNLQFLLGLRHEIEHVKPPQLDTYLSGRYQACALNYNHYVRKLFGARYGLDQHLTYSIQFAELTRQQVGVMASYDEAIPNSIRSYISRFDDGLNDDEMNSKRYSRRLFFTDKVVGTRGQADRVIEFISPDSEEAKEVPKERWVPKDTEKPKFRAKDVVRIAHEDGFASFGMYQHTQLWKNTDAKNPAKGYGVEVCNHWFWYQRWVDYVLQHLSQTAPETHSGH
jgi:hypothetical protein